MFKFISQYPFGLIQDILKFLPPKDTAFITCSSSLYEAYIPYLVYEKHFIQFKACVREKLLLDREFSANPKKINANKYLLKNINIVLKEPHKNQILETSLEIFKYGLQLRLKKIGLIFLEYLQSLTNTPFEIDAIIALFPLMLHKENYLFDEIVFAICGRRPQVIEHFYPAWQIVNKPGEKYRWHILDTITPISQKQLCNQGLKIYSFTENIQCASLFQSVTIPFISSRDEYNFNSDDVDFLIESYKQQKTFSILERLEQLSAIKSSLFEEKHIFKIYNFTFISVDLIDTNKPYSERIKIIFKILINLSHQFATTRKFIIEILNSFKTLEGNIKILPYILDLYSIDDLKELKERSETKIIQHVLHDSYRAAYGPFLKQRISLLGNLLSNLTKVQGLRQTWNRKGVEIFFRALEGHYINDSEVISQYILNLSFLLTKRYINKLFNRINEPGDDSKTALFYIIKTGYFSIQDYLNEENLNTLLLNIKKNKVQQILNLIIKKYPNVFDERTLENLIKQTDIYHGRNIYIMIINLLNNRRDLLTNNIKIGLTSLLNSPDIRIKGNAVHLFSFLVNNNLIEIDEVSTKILFLMTINSEYLKEEIVLFFSAYLSRNLELSQNLTLFYLERIKMFILDDNNIKLQQTALLEAIKLIKSSPQIVTTKPDLVVVIMDKLNNLSAESILAHSVYFDSPFLDRFPEKNKFGDLTQKYFGFFSNKTDQEKKIVEEKAVEMNLNLG